MVWFTVYEKKDKRLKVYLYPPPSWWTPILNSVNLTRALIFQKELRSGYGTNETDGLRTNEVFCEITVTFFVFCVCSHTTLFFWWGFFFVILWWRLCLLSLFNLSLTFAWTDSFWIFNVQRDALGFLPKSLLQFLTWRALFFFFHFSLIFAWTESFDFSMSSGMP